MSAFAIMPTTFINFDTDMDQTDTPTTQHPTQQQGRVLNLPADVIANIHTKLAKELGIKPAQVNAFVKLYDEGATVPFIARYRKEKTQGLDDSQLRALEKGLNYERDKMSLRLAQV